MSKDYQSAIRQACAEMADYIIEKEHINEADQEGVRLACRGMANFLLEKNVAYGNSIFEPVHIYSKVDTLEQINVRIDDKLSRLFRGKEYPGDDTMKDLAGYYLLGEAYRIAQDKVYPK